MADLNVNGKKYKVDVDPDTPLLWVIREQIGLTGTKYGCGVGQCGACTVLFEGQAMRSCSLPVAAADGKKIELKPDSEEYATIYAKFTDTEYVKNKTFNKNFFNDWKKILGKDSPIQSFDLCDFRQYHKKYLEDKELKKNKNLA